MTTVSKIIIKSADKKYEWSQTDETVVVYVTIRNVLLKNIDVFFSDNLLKINAATIKYFLAIDFEEFIDHKNPKNKVQLIDGRLNVLLYKKQAGIPWTNLEVQGLSKQQIMDRRNQSVQRYHELEEKLEKEAKSVKY